MARAMVNQKYLDARMRELGHYRVVRAQEIAEEEYGIPGSYLLALGLRETGDRNIRGGGTFDENNKWIPATDPKQQDVGWLQISQHWHEANLRHMPGVKEGTWGPVVKDKTAASPGYVPRYTDSLRYTLDEFEAAEEYARANGVPENQQLRFAIAAHNAGKGGAMSGWREGNVDKYTTHGDYSAWVIEAQKKVENFLNRHPNWKWEE